MSNLKETKVYSINDFINWHINGELELSPKYQRKKVWNAKAESYLIDTILRGLPIPQVFIRQTIDTKLRKTHREVIDGQQRLRAIINFENNKFHIMKTHNTELAGKYFDDLSEDQRIQFLDYQIPVEIIKTADDSIIYDMFMRVNTNSYTLNKQELRNAQYWGDFKVLVYKLASDWRSFFQDYRFFKDIDFLRMADAEQISSLLILIREGIIQDTPIKIDNYYKKYENMDDAEEVASNFNNIMLGIQEEFAKAAIEFTYLNRKNYFYTLFAYKLLMNGQLRNIDYDMPGNIISNNFVEILRQLESTLSDEDTYDENLIEFIRLHSNRTTNEKERKERFGLMIKIVEDLVQSNELNA